MATRVDGIYPAAKRMKMAARVDGIYPATERMKIEGRKCKFVRIDGAPQKEERQSSKEMTGIGQEL